MKDACNFNLKSHHLWPLSLGLNNKTSALQIVTICMAKNEQDVIEPFLRHNGQFSDLIILIDNSSTDNTKKIAMNTARELGNIVVTDFIDPAYNQSTTMSQALRYIQSAAFADFVFFLDADEFLQIESKDALCATLSSLSPRTIGLLPWKTFVPDPLLAGKSCTDPLDLMTLLRINEEHQYYKAVIRLSGKLDPSLCVSQGNHIIKNAYGSDLPSKIFENLAVAHIPVRSSEQLLAKGAVGWRANIRRKDFKPDQGSHWRRFHDLAEAGENLSAHDVAMEALNYALHKRKDTFDDNVIEMRPHLTTERRYSNGKYYSVEKLVDDYKHNTTLIVPPLPLPPRPSAMNDALILRGSEAANWQWNNLLLDETPFRFLIELFQPSSILDLGCGIGLYPLLYRYLGVKTVIGVDNKPIESTVLDRNSYINADLQQTFDAEYPFDMVICIDVARQMHPVHRDTFFDNLSRNAAGVIIFSMSGPDQTGMENIHCMSVTEILQLWADRGWSPDLPLTLGLRAICSLQSLRRNILVLRRDQDQNLSARAALEMIGAKKYSWYDEKFGQRYYAFSEKYPDPDQGYGSSFMVTKFVEPLTVKWRSFRRAVVRKLRAL